MSNKHLHADLSEDGELAAEDSNLFLVRSKRELSPSGALPSDEPNSKKQKVSHCLVSLALSQLPMLSMVKPVRVLAAPS